MWYYFSPLNPSFFFKLKTSKPSKNDLLKQTTKHIGLWKKEKNLMWRIRREIRCKNQCVGMEKSFINIQWPLSITIVNRMSRACNGDSRWLTFVADFLCHRSFDKHSRPSLCTYLSYNLFSLLLYLPFRNRFPASPEY